MQEALELLWPYTGEMFMTDAVDEAMAEAGIAPAAEDLRALWTADRDAISCRRRR